MKQLIGRISYLVRDFHGFYTLVFIIILFIFMSFMSPYFLTYTNITNIIVQSSVQGLLAIGMTFVIISGGIDLSVGSVISISGITLGFIMGTNLPYNFAFAIIGAICAGALIGFINGFLIAVCRMPPFIATLGMMSVARGLSMFWVRGGRLFGFGKVIMWIGVGKILWLPFPIIIFFIISFLAWYTLKYLKIGRYVFAIGGNEEASVLSGIDIKKSKIIYYTICGLTAAIGGLVLTARINSAQPIAGMGYELSAIAAVVIGGTSLAGGIGSIQGTVMGALLMGLIQNSMNLLDISPFLQDVVIGCVIIVAVLFDSLREK